MFHGDRRMEFSSSQKRVRVAMGCPESRCVHTAPLPPKQILLEAKGESYCCGVTD